MAESTPPIENVTIFNSPNFNVSDDSGKANFPLLQGILNAPHGIIYGDNTYQNSADVGEIGLKEIVFPPDTFASGSPVYWQKANYNFTIRAMRVRCIGGGGGGGGVGSNLDTEAKAGSGGSAGSYAERWITNMITVPPFVVIRIGAGGVGITGSAGQNGGTSQFSTGNPAVDITAVGGTGGNPGDTTDSEHFRVVSGVKTVNGANSGYITFDGEGSQNALSFGTENQATNLTPAVKYSMANASNGGSGFYGAGGLGATAMTSTTTQVGSVGGNGTGYGSGGGGAAVAGGTSNPSVSYAGGNGSDGVVILELWG